MEITGNQSAKEPNQAHAGQARDGDQDFEKYQKGPQGTDKAPGADPSNSNEDVIREAQKGKKVDADPSQPSDQPAN